jgi:predicted O-methyltransferase YrrM
VAFVLAYANLMHRLRRRLIRWGWISSFGRPINPTRWRLWARSLLSVFDVEDFIALDVPWWTFASTQKVEEFLSARPGARVFEWGSGGSTLWLAKRSESVISVEYDGSWAETMRPLLPENARLVREVPDRLTGALGEVGSKRMGFRHLDFADYVDAIAREEGLFDLIVIDGRAREACLDRAMTKLADGGVIVIDNTNRRRYRRALRALPDSVGKQVTRGLTPIVPWPTETTLLSFRMQDANLGD